MVLYTLVSIFEIKIFLFFVFSLIFLFLKATFFFIYFLSFRFLQVKWRQSPWCNKFTRADRWLFATIISILWLSSNYSKNVYLVSSVIRSVFIERFVLYWILQLSDVDEQEWIWNQEEVRIFPKAFTVIFSISQINPNKF